MAVASVWRKAWMRWRRVSSTTPLGVGGGDDGDGRGNSVQHTCGDSTTSGTTYTTTTTVTVTTSSFNSAGERPREFHSSMILPTTSVVEENTDGLDVAKEIEEDRVRKLEHLKGLVVEFRGGNNLSALEKWLSELDVGWVLHEFMIDESAGSIPCVESTDVMMRDHLSTELGKLDEAIWDTMVDIKTGNMAWMEGYGDSGHPCGSSDIHNVTRSLISDTKVLWANYGPLNRILHGAFLRGEFMPENENVSHLTNLIMEMVRSLEDKIARKSQCWFPDQSLRFLFLINNSYFMLQQLHTIWSTWRLGFPMPALTRRIDNYINDYLQVSWVPVLKCLHEPATPCCLTRRSPLTEFESRFHKTYAAQKLWKVPDPDMRKRMRKAIIEKVIPVFAQFLEDNSISTPGVTPKKLEEMLGELFEG
ncbi:unnamed protein product [Urochloa decumbens]|uniref:Exocyst subunit Exo70 family protein n=1 Tax=Urochloa decumbens TaxID=240449 RepID=A0ABC9DSK6_9POAL